MTTYPSILVTGDSDMVDRHRHLFEAITHKNKGINIKYLPVNSLLLSKRIKKLAKLLIRNIPFIPDKSIKRASSFRKKPEIFASKSSQAEQKIKALDDNIDLIFHIYGMFSPVWNGLTIPHVVYLDYTMALAYQNWRPWAPFKNNEDFRLWVDYEKVSYKNARHIFTKSNRTKQSLIKDYKIPADNISVIYSSGNFTESYQGEKSFGSQKILFNGSDFERKGGPLLLEAFQYLKQTMPEARLIIIGNEIASLPAGVENPGHVSSKSEMRQLFLDADLVVSPALCEPLGLFLVESMNYGIPCIVTNQDGMPEIIRHNQNGLVLNEPNSQDLANAMQSLLSKPERLQQMSDCARQRVKDDLTWDAVADKVMTTLNNL